MHGQMSVNPVLEAGSGMTASLCGVQDAPGQQGEQDGGCERGLGGENETSRGPRGWIDHRALKAQRELQNSSCVVHKSSKLEAI